jgi:hypothetical protein
MIKRFQISRSSMTTFFIAAGSALAFYLLGLQQSYRVGDGSEYIAMFIGWSEELRPWMNHAGFSAYDNYLKTGEILGGVSADTLKVTFPALSTISGQWDFNHFWFYPLAAFVCQFLLCLGLTKSPEAGFLLLHALLIFWLLRTSYAKFQGPGLIAALAIFLTSPAIWFTFAIHTEFWTFCLSTLAIIYLLAGEKTKAAVCFGLVATQNPSFAILAVLLVIWEIIRGPKVLRKLSFWIRAVTAASLCLIHPLYYLLRYSVPTPQLIAGGLNPGINLENWYVWFIDPDIGLFPNWPAGAVVLASSFIFLVRRGYLVAFAETFKISFMNFMTFTGIFVAASVYAQSGTPNLNSGATPGIARYAIWYLCLGFPFFLLLIRRVQKYTRPTRVFITSAATLFVIVNFIQNHPLKSESQSYPSAQGYFVQKNLSGLYNPPPEIFAERYSGVGEGVWSSDFTAVLGPDCRKVLVLKKTNAPVLSDNFNCQPQITLERFLELSSANDKVGNFYVSIPAQGN